MRRRALMGAQAKSKNGYVNGSYNKGSGATVYTVENNILRVENWKKGNGITLNLKEQVQIASGDSVKVYIERRSGSASGTQYVTVAFNSTNITINKLFKNTNPVYDQTATVSSTFSFNKIVLSCDSTAGLTYTDCTYTVKIYLNNVQVLPEL